MTAKATTKAKQASRRKRGVIRAKSTFFRSARYGLTLQEHRIIYYAILKGQQDGRPFEPVTLSIRDFMELCEFKGKSYYDRVRNLSKKITGKVVEVVYKDDHGEHLLQAPWLVGITYHTREGTVTIKPNKELQPFFEGKPFSETEYYFLIRFTSAYAERLYEILKSLNHKTVIDFEVDDLRLRLAIPPMQYQNFADLKRRVIDPAMRDINEFTDIAIDMRSKRGLHNKVTTVIFSLTRKKAPHFADQVSNDEYTTPLSEEDSHRLLCNLLGDDAPELPGQLSFDEIAEGEKSLMRT